MASDGSSPVRNHIIAFIGEFVGTFMFLFTAFAATQVATEEDDVEIENLLYIAGAFGAAVTVNAWIFFRVSGSAFNPVVSGSPSSSFNVYTMLNDIQLGIPLSMASRCHLLREILDIECCPFYRRHYCLGPRLRALSWPPHC